MGYARSMTGAGLAETRPSERVALANLEPIGDPDGPVTQELVAHFRDPADLPIRPNACHLTRTTTPIQLSNVWPW